ncbi:MAG TPA: hypothetical protein VEB68_02935 [Croceibacterium sp.]|nr:hypothetical protein [Croceibacterium sp.]
MDDESHEPHFETDAARGGSTPHIVRWILAISLFAAIALLSVIWITGAATQGDKESTVSYPPPTQSAGDQTDSIVGEDADEIEAAEPGDADSEAQPVVEN